MSCLSSFHFLASCLKILLPIFTIFYPLNFLGISLLHIFFITKHYLILIFEFLDAYTFLLYFPLKLINFNLVLLRVFSWVIHRLIEVTNAMIYPPTKLFSHAMLFLMSLLFLFSKLPTLISLITPFWMILYQFQSLNKYNPLGLPHAAQPSPNQNHPLHLSLGLPLAAQQISPIPTLPTLYSSKPLLAH